MLNLAEVGGLGIIQYHSTTLTYKYMPTPPEKYPTLGGYPSLSLSSLHGVYFIPYDLPAPCFSYFGLGDNLSWTFVAPRIKIYRYSTQLKSISIDFIVFWF